MLCVVCGVVDAGLCCSECLLLVYDVFVAQWIRHPPTKREIAGSSPVEDFCFRVFVSALDAPFDDSTGFVRSF